MVRFQKNWSAVNEKNYTWLYNYLKTIYDLPKQSYVKIQFEINGLFDYRNDENENEKNKAGLIVYATKIIVLKKLFN